MKEKKIKMKVKGKSVEPIFYIPETIEEALKMMPQKDIMVALEQRCIYLAKLNLLRDGKPAKERKKITIDLTKLSDKEREALQNAGLI
jgi:hypothetical protein